MSDASFAAASSFMSLWSCSSETVRASSSSAHTSSAHTGDCTLASFTNFVGGVSLGDGNPSDEANEVVEDGDTATSDDEVEDDDTGTSDDEDAAVVVRDASQDDEPALAFAAGRLPACHDAKRVLLAGCTGASASFKRTPRTVLSYPPAPASATLLASASACRREQLAGETRA